MSASDALASTVELEVPARGDFVASIRAMTRSAAVLSDLPVTDVEELQIAVDEAATLLLPLVDEARSPRLRASFGIAQTQLAITLRAECTPGTSIDRAGLAWRMLAALDPDVSVARQDGAIAISIRRPVAGPSS
jgi:serine/threonine-protein kinase RsbW